MARSLRLALTLAALLAAAPAAAQWKAGGVAFPITPLDDVHALLGDGVGGAYFLYIPIFGARPLAAQHVLADGSIDPLDGATGQLVASTPQGVGSFAAIADGGTGALVSFIRCAPPQAHTQCWETGQIRLARWRSGGPAPGWPDSGVVIGPSVEPAVPPLVSGGDGGAILLYDDVLARVAGDGANAWAPEPGYPGVRYSIGVLPREDVQLAADGGGGTFVTWDEPFLPGSATLRARLNRVTPAGARQFGGSGLTIVAREQLAVRAFASDGAGGTWLAWSVPVAGSASLDSLYVQHLDASGSPTWESDGVPAGMVARGAPVPLVAAGEDEVLLALRSAALDPLVQKLAQGGPGWPGAPDGLAVGLPGEPARGVCAAPDGAGGTWVAWSDARDGSLDPFVTRLDPTGAAAPGWSATGTALATSPDDESVTRILTDTAAGEAIVAWWRPSSVYVSLSDLYLQKVVPGGVLVAAPPAPALALAAPWPNPASDGWTVSFRLPAPGDAVLELFDVAGRRLERARVRVDDAAPRRAHLGGAALAPGVYRVRLSSADGERTRVVVLAR